MTDVLLHAFLILGILILGIYSIVLTFDLKKFRKHLKYDEAMLTSLETGHGRMSDSLFQLRNRVPPMPRRISRRR